MVDSFGDGWNGNILDFGGLGSFTIASGATGSTNFLLTHHVMYMDVWIL